MPQPMQLPPASLDAFQTRQRAPAMSPMADSRQRVAGNVMDSQPEQGKKYEDYFADGWGYRLFGDGKIKVIVAPEGHRSGAIIDGGPAYDAITSRIKMVKDFAPKYDNMEADFAPGAEQPPAAPPSGVESLLDGVPDMGPLSQQTVKAPAGQDKAALDTMRPSEGLDFDPTQLTGGL